MKLGKLQESILDRSVFKQLHGKNDKVLCKPKVGQGFQLLDMTEVSALATTVNVVEGSWEQVSALLVPRAVNSLWCSGAEPLGIMVALVLPASLEEPDFRRMIHGVDEACAAENICVLGGHTQISAGVDRVIATVTAYGTYVSQDFSRAKAIADKGGPKPGQDIVMTKWGGLSGTWLLEQRMHKAFEEKYNPYLCDCISQMKADFFVSREAVTALSYGAQTLYDLSETGVFGGLWELAAKGGVGLLADLKKIPLRQETVELCDFADVNPYLIPSLGSLLIAADHGEGLVQRLRGEGICAAVIGSFTDSHDRVIINEDEVRYLEPFRGSVI